MNSKDVILYIFLIIFLSDAIEMYAQCHCGKFIGTHCGDRMRDELLIGECQEDILYQCLAARFPAQKITNCGFCQKGRKAGSDYCIVGSGLNYLKASIFLSRMKIWVMSRA
jgi:hypothetical protein